MSETLPVAISQLEDWAQVHGIEMSSHDAETGAAEMVMLAYEKTAYPSGPAFDEKRQDSVAEFENRYFEECYKALTPDRQSQAGSFGQQTVAISGRALPSVEVLADVETGYYLLTTTSQYDSESSEEVEYSISHIAVDMNYQGYGTKLQAGIARSGFIPIGVYFDYNSDGVVDSDMAIDFVRDIPFIGRRLANAYDPEVAQNLYSIFAMERKNASYTSAEDMANATSEKSSVLWAYVMDNYDALAAWIGGALEETDSPPAVGAE